MLRFERMTPAATRDLLAFFDRPDQGFCFCRFWFFDGDTDAWLAADAADNRRRCERDGGAGDLDGVLARDGEAIVGWLRLARTAAVRKLRSQGLEDGPPAGAMSVLCMAVAEERRGEGIAAAMLDATLELLDAQGVPEVHAYPRPADGLDAGAVWTGPMKLYRSRGFGVVREGERRATVVRVLPSGAGET